jgi:hypothetical protein
MWRLWSDREGSASYPRTSPRSFQAQERIPITRHHIALAEAARRLEDALLASPHAVYLRSNGVFEPALVRGIDDAPTFPAEGSLPRELCRTGGPVMTQRSHRARLLDAALDPEDSAALRRAGAIALVPLSPDRKLEAFLLVGGPLGAFDPDRLARALAPVSACLRIARDGAPVPGPEPPLPAPKGVPDPACI